MRPKCLVVKWDNKIDYEYIVDMFIDFNGFS
jgi:hypothetical protein